MMCGHTKWERKTVQQFHQVPTTPLFLDTCHWRTAAACAQHPSLTVLAPLSSALFCTRTTCTLSHPLPTIHGLLTEPFSEAQAPMCGLHPPPMHAHCTRIRSRGCYGRRERGNGREIGRLSTPLQKVPVRNLAFHVMPRQRLYPVDFGQITIFAWPLPGITWND